MSENAEPLEFSEDDIADLHTLGITEGDEPSFHPILEVWREVLKPAKGELTSRVTPQWATRLVNSYSGLGYADVATVQESLFTKLIAFEDILLAEIATDDECLNASTPEEDVETNSGHYRNLLRDWQMKMVGWEIEWDPNNADAAAEIAALSELHKMIFGQTGLTAFLDNIKFQYTEADQAELAQALESLKEEQ